METLLTLICKVRDSINPALPVWPGCSVSATEITRQSAGRVRAVRPGAYVFGDLSLTKNADVMPWDQVALQVLATVVDLPTPGLALIDAGSKTFSSDRTADGISALAADGRDIAVVAVNEEHGYVRGTDVAQLKIGDRLLFVPAHVCTVVNLANELQVINTDQTIRTTWPIEARGKNQ